MLRNNFLMAIIFYFCLTLTLPAANLFEVATIDPQTTKFSAYLSYKHNLLLISLRQTASGQFNCQPNRYIFYNFKTDQLHEEKAGNLVINSSFSRYVTARIHTLNTASENNKHKLKNKIQKLIQKMDISAATLEKGKTISPQTPIQCWQQPVIKNIAHQPLKQLPYLLANLCEKNWCSDIYWPEQNKIRFWAHIEPEYFHLIELNQNNKSLKLLKKTKRFIQKYKSQDNAPRKNLVDLKKSPQKSYTLTSGKNGLIEFRWQTTKNGRIRIVLARSTTNPTAANKMAINIARKIKQKQLTDAIQFIKFGFWLAPKNPHIKYEQLKAFANLRLYNEFFNYLTTSFNREKRMEICQKIHIEPDFQTLRSTKIFPDKFRKICF